MFNESTLQFADLTAHRTGNSLQRTGKSTLHTHLEKWNKTGRDCLHPVFLEKPNDEAVADLENTH